LETNEITSGIIGASTEVHKELGSGLLESAYEQCLVHLLKLNGFIVEQQFPVPVVFRDLHLDYGYRLDLLVEKEAIIEIKSVDLINPVHEVQILTYMKFAQKRLDC
jgi:GxxExxY protein